MAGEPQDQQLLDELRSSQRQAWESGAPLWVEDYLQQHPELSTDEERLLDFIYSEYCLREELGLRPEPAEYLQRFPPLAERLQRLFDVHQAVGAGFGVSAGPVSVDTSKLDQKTDIHASGTPKLDSTVPPIPARNALSTRLVAGMRLGDYVLVEKLGEGGMGLVFKAEHRRMKRTVALKVLSSQVADSPEATERFQREVEALARLKHPHIVTAHDAREDSGIFYFVMELVSGQDLARCVAAQGPLSAAEAVDYVLQAARGLEYAHGQGVIHRDVKPSNLLLEDTGSIKLLDLGLAHFEPVAGYAGRATMTGSGTIVGTVDYMSPEQAFRPQEVDRRSDIYSLGCTLYYLLTGQPVYAGGTALEKLLAHKEQPIPSLREKCPEATVELESLFRKMVAKAPADRFQTMGEVINSIQSLAAIKIISDAVESLSSRPAEEQSAYAISAVQPFVAPHRVARRLDWRWPAIGAAIAIALLGGMLRIYIVRSNEMPDSVDVGDIAPSVNQEYPPGRVSQGSILKSLTGTWNPGDEDNSLPGFILRPAKLPGIRRWNIYHKTPKGGQFVSIEWGKGNCIALGTSAGQVNLYQPQNGIPMLKAIFPARAGREHCIAWSPNGELLATLGDIAGDIRVWKADGTSVAAWHAYGGEIWQIAWNRSGQQLAVAGTMAPGEKGKSIRIWNLDGKPAATIPANGEQGLNWNGDGRRLLACANNRLSIWDVSTATPECVAFADGNAWNGVWSPDGKLIAVHVGAQVKLFDEKAQPVLQLDQNSDPRQDKREVRFLAWSATGDALAAVGDAGLAIWQGFLSWDRKQPPVRSFYSDAAQDKDFGGFHRVAWSPDDKSLACCNSHDLRIVDLGFHTVGKVAFGGASYLSWGDREDTLAIVANLPSQHIYEIRACDLTGTRGTTFSGHKGIIHEPSWSHDGKWLMSYDASAQTRLWSRDGQCLAEYNAFNYCFNGFVWSYDGQFVARMHNGLLGVFPPFKPNLERTFQKDADVGFLNNFAWNWTFANFEIKVCWSPTSASKG